MTSALFYACWNMAFSKATRARLLASVVIAVVVALLGLALRSSESRWGSDLQRASYDTLHSWAGLQSTVIENSPVVIVYLDLKSFNDRGLDPARTWPRELHAQLLHRLKRAGARAIAFDIVFGGTGPDAGADEKFAGAIHAAGNVVLAAEYNDKASDAHDYRQSWAKLHTVGSVHEPFRNAASGVGIASMAIDDDQAIRRFLAGFPDSGTATLAWATAQILKLPVTQEPDGMVSANQRWLRYYGPALTLPHVSYSQALAPDGVPDDFFRDKIVFVGARPLVELFNDRQDEFRSPFHSWRYKESFVPGVEIHATEMLNLLRGEALFRTAQGVEFALILLAAVIGGILVWLRPIPAFAVAGLGIGGTVLATTTAFAHGTWFPWLILAGIQIPTALGGSVLYYSAEWYRTRRKYEARIREQAALIDKAHDAILVQNLDGQITYANPSAVQLYGWTLAELQEPKNLEQLFSAADATKARAAAQRDGEWNGELKQQAKAGKPVIVASRWTLIRGTDGQPRELLLINSDITAEKELEQQFLRTQRMNTIGALAGGMAHDLNNALAPILIGAQLLRRKAGDDDTRNLLSMMETNTMRGADMVRQVLLFARGKGGDFERLELAKLVRELEKMVRETFPKNLALETYLPADLWAVRGNPTQLHQVLLNLCVNARDAMPGGGKLSFVADNVVVTEADLAGVPDGRTGDFVSLLVSDTGTGMPPEVLAKIFEPFFTTKGEGKGTGIGLATVVRIVKAHGGFLRVESTPGEGTSFEVFLPRAREVVPVTEAKAAKLPRGNGELILIADDERAILELIASELKAFGYRTLTSANGAEAVAAFREHAGEVKLFIADGSMPVMTGPEAIAQIRQLRADLPAILSSGEPGALGEQKHITLLNKPYALEELLTAVHRCLH